MLPPVTFPTLGWQVIDWIEAYLVHGPGDIAGQPIAVDDEVALLICWLYRVWPQDHPLAGRRLIFRGVYSRPKGRAKSETAGEVVCAEALGPVRCDGFDANGEPVGVPVRYPFIRCLATEEKQAGNTYDNVFTMLTEGEAINAYALDVGLTRTFIREPGGGEIRPSSAGAASKDGGKETHFVADETHLYESTELRGMYRTVARNTGKRKIAEPWGLDTTTMWRVGAHSIAEQAAEKYADLPVEECVVKHGVLWDHRQGDKPKRFGDDRSLIKAMRPAYGPAADWIDFRRIVQIIRDAEDPVEEAYRYYLNLERAAASSWMAPDEIAAALTDDVVEPGSKVCAGFDGSDSDDHTALWICTREGLLVPVGIWGAPEGRRPVDDDGNEQEWHVPRGEVTAAVRWIFQTFKVLRFYGDPPWWITEMAEWAAEHGSPPVTEWWTNRDTPMAVACGDLRTSLRNGSAKINPHELQTANEPRQGKALAVWHFENARKRKVRIKLEDKAEEAHVVRKVRPGSPLKIDSVPAAALAKKAVTDAIGEGEFDEPEYDRGSW